MRFNEAMNEERVKASEGPKTPKPDKDLEAMKEIKREIKTNERVRKLLDTGRRSK